MFGNVIKELITELCCMEAVMFVILRKIVKMLRWVWLSFLVMFTAVQAKAIDAVVAHTVFYLQDTSKNGIVKPYVEVSWEINPRSLHYVRQKDSMLLTQVQTDVVFSNDEGIVAEDHFLFTTEPGKHAQQVLSQNMQNLRRYIVKYGRMKMHIKMADVTDTMNRFVYNDSFDVAAATNTAFYSGIQLLDTFYASTASTIYQKNYRQQIPLCTNFYDQNRNQIHYYVELYNTTTIPQDEYPLVQYVSISRKEGGSPINDLASADTILSESIQPMLGTFPLESLGSGNYYLNVSLKNALNKTIAANDVFFQRFNEHPVEKKKDTSAKAGQGIHSMSDIQDVTLLDLNKTFLAKYNLVQIKAILNMMIPLSDANGIQTIRGFLKKPDEMYMRYYIYNFFTNRDRENPGKAWEAYADTVKIVNKLFGTTGTPGYLTDQGIVYLKYGAPTERVTVENEAGSLPYEIWQYNNLYLPSTKRTMTNAIFLFYRPSDEITGFFLLHSTVPGELKNMSWRSYLYTNSSVTGNSRAEQYLQGTH